MSRVPNLPAILALWDRRRDGRPPSYFWRVQLLLCSVSRENAVLHRSWRNDFWAEYTTGLPWSNWGFIHRIMKHPDSTKKAPMTFDKKKNISKFTAWLSGLRQGLTFEEGMVSPQNCEETQIARVVHKDTRIKQNDCSSNAYLGLRWWYIFFVFSPRNLGKMSNLTFIFFR